MSARKTSARRNLGSSGAAFKRSAPPDWRSQLRCSTALVPLERMLAPVMLAGGLLGSVSALANPLGGQVAGGTATISQPSTTQTVINQSSQSTVINWQSFNIPQGSQVDFNQPNSSSVALNRDLSNNASQIAGQLNANGQVWIVNPNGVAFTPTAQVNVGGLVATTSNISNSNFLAGIYKFDQPGKPTASVVNQGNITVRQAGLADLVAPSVSNSGVIQAKLGKVNLASGSEYTIDMYGDGMIKFAVNDQTAAALTGARVGNTGTINAAGGTVTLSVSEAESIVDNSINAGGTITARTVGSHTGQITVDGNGGTTVVSGTLDASGTGTGQTGGTVKVLGGQVGLTSTAKIDVSGNAGGGNVDIGGDFHGAGPDADATNTVVQQGATIDADAITDGNGGQVAVWSNGHTNFDGKISAKGGAQGGNGGYVETSGEGTLSVGAAARVDASALRGKAGMWLLDPDSNIDITNTTNANQIAGSGGSPDLFQPTTDSSTINPADIITALNGGTSVTVTTSNGGGTQPGNINVGVNANGTDGEISGFNAPSAVTLTLLAGSGGGAGVITVNSPINDTGSAGALSLNMTAGGGIAFDNTISVVGNLNATATTGNITQTAALTVGGTSSFTTDATNATITLNTATNALGGTVTLSTTGSSADASLVNNVATTLAASTVGGTLTLDTAANNLTLNGVTAGGLTLTTTGTVSLDGGTYSIASPSPYVFPAVTTNGTLILGQATNFGAVTLGSPTTFNSSTANGAITFDDAVSGAGKGLTVTAGSGNVAFDGAVGASGAGTGAFGATTTGTTTLGGNVYAASLDIAGPTSLGNSLTVFTDKADTGAGADGAITFGGNIAGGTNTLSLSAGSGAETLAGITSGDLTLTTTGTVTLNAGTYSIGAPPSLYAFPAVTTNGRLKLGQATSFFGAVILGSTTTFDTTVGGTVPAGANIAFDSTINGTAAGAQAMIVTAGTGGTVVFEDNVGTTVALGAVTLSGALLDILPNVNVTTQGGAFSQTGRTILLGHVATSTTIDTTNAGVATAGANITFDGTVNGTTAGDQALTVKAGSGHVAFDSTVGAANAGTGAFGVTTTGTTTFSGNVWAASLDITGPTVLGTTLTIDTSAADTGAGSDGTITLAAVNGTTAATQGLTLTSGTGAISLGTVGGTTSLLSLATTGTTGTTTLKGNVTTSGGVQTYTGPVTLTAATTSLDTTGGGASAAGANITFDGTVNGTTAGDQALTVTAGTGGVVLFEGNVGTTTALGALTLTDATLDISANKNVTMQGGAFSQTGATVLLGGVATSTTIDTTNAGAAAAGANITFDGTVNGTTAGDQALTVTAGNGIATFEGTVGSGKALSQLSVIGPADLNGGAVTTSGTQTYGGAVTLTGDVTLATTNSLVDFGSTIDDATANTHSLSVQSGTGGVTFGAAVGGSHPLASLDTTGTTGTNTLDGNVSTGGAQTYGGAVTVGGNITLATTNSLLDFGSTVDDATANTHNLAIQSGTGGVTFGAAVGGILPLASLDTTGTTGTNTLDGNVSTGSIQTYGGPVALNAASVTLTTTNALVTLPPVSVATTTDTLTVNSGSGGVVLNGVTAGGLTLTTTGPETVNAGTYDIDGGVGTVTFASIGGIDLDGNITLDNPTTFGSGSSAVALTGATTLQGGAAADTIDFAGTLDGAFALNVTGSQTTILDLAIGGLTPLASIDVAGPTDLQASATTTGTQTYSGAVTLTGDVTLKTTNSLVDFGSTVDDATNDTHSLSIQSGTGGVTFGAAVGGAHPLASLDTTGTTGTNTLDGAVRTGGLQTYGGPVTLGATPIVLTTLSNGAVTFGSSVAGAGDRLTVNTGSGNVTFDGAVGASGAGIGSLSTATTGTTTLNGSIYAASLDVGGATTLGSNVSVFTDKTDTGGTSDGPITFGGNIAGGANTLALNSGAGAITLNGVTAHALTVTVTGPETVNAGTYDIDGGTGTVTFASIGGIDLDGNITLDNPTTFGSGSSAVALTGATTLQGGAAADTIDLAGTLDGAFALNVTGSQTTILDLAIGGHTPLASIDIAGPTDLQDSVTTTATQTYGGAVTLTGDITLKTTNSLVDFVSTVDDATNNTHSLSIAAGTGGVTFGAAVGTSHSLASLDTTGTTGTNTLDGNVTTGSLQTYGGAVTLGATTILLTTGAGAVTFDSTVAGAGDALTVDSTGGGAIAFDSTVGSSGSPLGAVGLTTSGPTLLGGAVFAASLNASGATGSITLDGGVTTGGAQTYGGAVTLGTANDLTGTNVTFDSTVGGAHALTVTGNGVFDGAVTLASLDVTGTSGLNGDSVTTAGTQTYGGAVTLGTDNDLTGTSVTFDSTVGGAHALTVTGNGVFDGGVNIASLDVTGTSGLNGNTVTTTGPQTYGGAVTLGTNDVLSSSGTGPNGNITFASTVDSGTNAGSPFGLTVNTAGTTTFDGAVGGMRPLLSVTTDAPGTTDLNGGVVDTTGTQTFSDPIALTASEVLISSGTGTNGNITFASTVDSGTNAGSPFGLTVNTAGTTTFDAAVGGMHPLVSVTTDAPGTTDLNGGVVNTTATQNYNDPVTLTGDSDLAATTVMFGSTVGGAHNLTVTGNGVFDGAVNIASLDVTGTSGLNGNSVTTTGTQTYGGAVTLGTDNDLTGTSVTFDSTVGGAHALTVTGNGVFDGGVNIASLDVTGTSGLNGNTVTTTGTQTYGGAVTLGTDNDLTGTNVTLGSTVDGAHDLTVTGNGMFDGAVGGTTKLASLTVTDMSDLNGGAVSTTGTQNYDGAVTLGTNNMLNVSTATFDSTIGGHYALVINGNAVFHSGSGAASTTVTGTINNVSSNVVGVIGIATVLGLINDLEEQINRGGTGETAAQAAFEQRVYKADYAVDPFALKYNILGLGGSDVPGFNDISYVLDGFWENLIKKQP